MKNQLLFLFLVLSGGCFAQQPEFSFELYFEDAIGNKDTVTLGYDPLATDTINPQFGEINLLNTPWGNGLDVRIGNLIYHNSEWGVTSNTPPMYYFSDSISVNTYLTEKKIVEHVCNLQYENASRRVSIQFFSNNFPIVVKWNKTHFGINSCVGFSMIYGESDHMQVDVGGNFLLGMRDSIQVLGNSKIEGSEIIPNYINPANPSQTIYVLQFNFVNALTTSVDNYGQIVEQIKVFPNPIPRGELLNIKVIGEYQIVNELGQVIQKGEIINNAIPINVKNAGLYFLKVIPADIFNKLNIHKIIVK